MRIRAHARVVGFVGNVFEGLLEGGSELRRVRLHPIMPLTKDTRAIPLPLKEIANRGFGDIELPPDIGPGA
jgi:hypothetical protein